jgi:hypothetical protein
MGVTYLFTPIKLTHFGGLPRPTPLGKANEHHVIIQPSVAPEPDLLFPATIALAMNDGSSKDTPPFVACIYGDRCLIVWGLEDVPKYIEVGPTIWQ